jgi:hypothetical protein
MGRSCVQLATEDIERFMKDMESLIKMFSTPIRKIVKGEMHKIAQNVY